MTTDRGSKVRFSARVATSRHQNSKPQTPMVRETTHFGLALTIQDSQSVTITVTRNQYQLNPPAERVSGQTTSLNFKPTSNIKPANSDNSKVTPGGGNPLRTCGSSQTTKTKTLNNLNPSMTNTAATRPTNKTCVQHKLRQLPYT